MTRRYFCLFATGLCSDKLSTWILRAKAAAHRKLAAVNLCNGGFLHVPFLHLRVRFDNFICNFRACCQLNGDRLVDTTHGTHRGALSTSAEAEADPGLRLGSDSGPNLRAWAAEHQGKMNLCEVICTHGNGKKTRHNPGEPIARHFIHGREPGCPSLVSYSPRILT